MPAGIAEQIDELDQLLDKLLHLPIEQATAAPAVLPIKPVAVVLEPEATKPILRFSKELPGLVLHQETSMPSVDVLEDQHAVTEQTEEPSPAVLSLHATDDETPTDVSQEEVSASEPVAPSTETTSEPHYQLVPVERIQLPVDEIPWLDDEPLPVSKGTGPKVEIIRGATSQIIHASALPEPVPVPQARKQGWTFWILWTWTWLFDQTIGRWFPFFRRPNVKLLLGLIGVALFAGSIYLTWKGLRW